MLLLLVSGRVWNSIGTDDDIDLEKFYGFFSRISLIWTFFANKDQNNWKRSINKIFEIDHTEAKRTQNILKIFGRTFFENTLYFRYNSIHETI